MNNLPLPLPRRGDADGKGMIVVTLVEIRTENEDGTT